MKNVFQDMSQKLKNADEKHFKIIQLRLPFEGDEQRSTLDDDTFADITFDELSGSNIKKLGTKSLSKTASTIKSFTCIFCDIQHSPPNYNIWQVLGSLTNVDSLSIGLNVSEIPTNAISNSANQPKVSSLHINTNSFRKGDFRVKSRAFNNLRNLNDLSLTLASRGNIYFEKEAFKFPVQTSETLRLKFGATTFKGALFDEETFSGLNRPINIEFSLSFFDYIPEKAFKSVLDNKQNKLNFDASAIDCENCGNYWLVNRTQQMKGSPQCTHNVYVGFYDFGIPYLKAHCK